MSDKPNTPLMAYAAHAGIAYQVAARELRKVGITYTAPFDWAVADAQREAARHLRCAKGADVAGDIAEVVLSGALPGALAQNATFAEAQRHKEIYKARAAQIDYEIQIGQLVEMAVIEREAFTLARAVRDAILNIPDRLIPLLAVVEGREAMHALLLKELQQALEGLADD